MLRYKLLGRSGLRVSEICLGTMSFGNDWGFGADEETSHKVLDAYAEAGGNFLDTANKYHNGETEEICGNWLKGKRHEMVVATKYTLAMNHKDPNTAGNHRKNLVRSVEKSLERLDTDYIDLLWVHAWDNLTPYEETLRALDDIIRSGKVLYVGISDAPAWVVSASQVHAELRGWSSYVGLQIEHSLIERTPERDLLPMADHFGLSVLAWAPLGGGVLTGKYTRDGADRSDSKRSGSNESRGRTSEKNLQIARTVDAIADEVGASSAQVAVAWSMAQHYNSIPIVGARKVSQITDTLGAAEVTLSKEQLERLDKVSQIKLGFPHDFLQTQGMKDILRSEQHGRIALPAPGDSRHW